MEDAGLMAARKLLFLITEDWFFRSHFMPLLERARADGFEVLIAGRMGDAEADLTAAGARTIAAPFARGSLKIGDVRREAGYVRELIERERPDIVHAIALKPITLLMLSGAKAPRVLAVTGRGYIAVARALWPRGVAWTLARMIRANLNDPRAILAVENVSDRRWVEGGAPLPDERVVLMPGAGVEPERFNVAPEPASPVVIGVAARLIWSKGIDVAVDAVKRLRQQGLDVSLRIAGAPDRENPEHVAEEEIARWRDTAGVSVLGRVNDVNSFWAGTHIACLPSRGGEGLPRSLLEAAACGRAIVTTTAPGCADFVREGENGLVVPPSDSLALSEALKQLALDPALRVRMGKASREIVLAGYTTTHAAAAAASGWQRLTAR